MTPEEIAAYIGQNTKPGEARMDAGSTATLARQLEHVESTVYQTKYPAFKARMLIPLDTSIPSGAETVTYQMWDSFAMAKVVANAADDLPLVDVMAKEFSARVKSLGVSFTYSVQDLRAIALSGQPIDTMRAIAARRAIEAGMDEVAAFGLPEASMPGFLNHPNVPLIAPTTGNWASATAEQIFADLNKLVSSMVTATRGIHMPDTMLLDTASFELLASKPVGSDFSKTILRVFLDSNVHIRNIDSWYQLDKANVAGTGPRAMVYARTPEVVQLRIPQGFEQFPPQARNLAFVIPCHSRIGGVAVRFPMAMAYMDGIG